MNPKVKKTTICSYLNTISVSIPYVVKNLFGLVRSLFNIVHFMTDQDSSLRSSFIVGNITKSNEIT
jgi:hypothetical protein